MSLGPCLYPGGAEWAAVQARKASRTDTMAPFHIEASGAVTSVRTAALAERWHLQQSVGVVEEQGQRLEESALQSLQRKARASGQRAALEIVGQKPGTGGPPSPPALAPSSPAERRLPQSWHQVAERKSVSFEQPLQPRRQQQVEEDEDEDLWGAGGEAAEQQFFQQLEPEQQQEALYRHAAGADDDLQLLERHQALVQAELEQSVKRTYEMEERLRRDQRSLSQDQLAPAQNSGGGALTRSFAAEHPWQVMTTQQPPAAAAMGANWIPSTAAQPRAAPSPRGGGMMTLSERFDAGRRFQQPTALPGRKVTSNRAVPCDWGLFLTDSLRDCRCRGHAEHACVRTRARRRRVGGVADAAWRRGGAPRELAAAGRGRGRAAAADGAAARDPSGRRERVCQHVVAASERVVTKTTGRACPCSV